MSFSNERPQSWSRSAEGYVANAQENGLSLTDLVEKSRVQVAKYADANQNLVTVFIGTGLRDKILNAEDQVEVAKRIARTESQYLRDVDIDDMDHQAAFLIALAKELQQPKYNQ